MVRIRKFDSIFVLFSGNKLYHSFLFVMCQRKHKKIPCNHLLNCTSFNSHQSSHRSNKKLGAHFSFIAARAAKTAGTGAPARGQDGQGQAQAEHVQPPLPLPRGQEELLPDHLQLAGQRPRVQRPQLLLRRPRGVLTLGVLYQLRGGDPVLLRRVVYHGQMGSQVDPVCHHDGGGHLLHLLHVRTLG